MSTGLCVKLDQNTPTIINVEGRTIHLFDYITPCGNRRVRIVADRDIKITGPHRVKKQFGDGFVSSLENQND